jgi:DNA-binding NarL/FixJ family response regulator
MTLLASSEPTGLSHGSSPSRVRIGITSPDILAQIRQVFASRNLAVEIVRMPYVEIAVRPAASTVSANTVSANVSAAGLSRLVGAAAPPAAPGARRLRAEYRLIVVDADDGSKVEHHVPAPAPDADDGSPTAVLSRRQHEVMALVSRGVRNAEIAERLRVSEKTVKNHINRIFRSLGAGSRVEAVLIWQRRQRDGAIRRGAPTPPSFPTDARHPGPAGSP